MARTTGNVATAGFAAGQLRDGQLIGVFDWYNSSKFEVRVRYYQNKLIAELRWQNNGTWGAWACQARGYFNTVKNGYTSGAYTELNESTVLFAEESEILALGIPMPGGAVPTAPTNALMPFQADADGRVTVFAGTPEENNTTTTDTNLISGTDDTDNPAPKPSWSETMLKKFKVFLWSLGFSPNSAYQGLGLGGIIIAWFWGVVGLVVLVVLFVAHLMRKANPKFWKAAKVALIITVSWFAFVLVRIRMANKAT